MPRKGHIAKRGVEPDPVYASDLVTKFVNSMMWAGKKSTAEGIFYEALTRLQQKGGDEPLKLFKKAVENVKPLLEVKTRRVGGANYQVPVEVNPDRRTSLAIRWLITYSRGRAEKGMIDKLSNELLDAANNRGAAIIRSIQQLVAEFVDHPFLGASTRVRNQPADCKRGAPVRIHFHRHLIVRAANAASLHFKQRLDVFHRLFEQLQRLISALLL